MKRVESTDLVGETECQYGTCQFDVFEVEPAKPRLPRPVSLATAPTCLLDRWTLVITERWCVVCPQRVRLDGSYSKTGSRPVYPTTHVPTMQATVARNDAVSISTFTSRIWHGAGCVTGSPSVGLLDGFPW